ncbi:hypothetical protein C2G38_2165087 [Gigaspora rosea]|uniref:ZSWIM1/3 RNaseH-like domain-containing protein n=1 Tax=Gigaspora rosea TaxID=44941 RepID=A0A397VXQ7_9GLOM|nr:hypothetical protein C2G38_2165087 [Gigaspora rosea]
MEAKVRIEHFENSPDHTHTLDDIKKIKCSQVVRNLVEQEFLKDYRPPPILNAVKEYAKEKLNLNKSVKELRCKEVTNIKYKVCGFLDVHLIGNPKRLLDIQKSISFLEQQNLEKYGWLTLIDYTHKTNRYDYRLFTLYICNGYGCWNVGAHFFVSKEDRITVVEAFKKIQRFALNWKPRYILQDQSSIEERACNRVVTLDQKKYSDSEYVVPLFIQQMLADKARGVEKRIEKNGFDIYMHHEVIEVNTSEKDKAEGASKHR